MPSPQLLNIQLFKNSFWAEEIPPSAYLQIHIGGKAADISWSS